MFLINIQWMRYLWLIDYDWPWYLGNTHKIQFPQVGNVVCSIVASDVWHPALLFNIISDSVSLQTTLAHIIASSSKKNGTARFVALSATSSSTNEVREVIKQAQNELRLFKRKTILFIDEIHRFNKSQQVCERNSAQGSHLNCIRH